MKGAPVIIVSNNLLEYNGLYIEFKLPSNKPIWNEKNNRINSYKLITSNDYEYIITKICMYVSLVRIKFEYCNQNFKSEYSL